MQTVTKADTRQNLLISSFAQTDSDPSAVEMSRSPPIQAATEMTPPAVVGSSSDTVDTAMQESVDMFDEKRLSVVARCMPMHTIDAGGSGEEEFVSLADRTSMYQTFDEVYELDAKVRLETLFQ